MQGHRSTLVRGAIAGLMGAATLAIFFFIVDTIRGTPLQTPGFLAAAVAGRDASEASAALIALYTLLHAALFVGTGIAAARLIEGTGIRPHFLLGAVLGFLLFDIVFYAGVVVTGTNVVQALGWPAVLAGNLLAGVAMFGYLQATSPADTPSWSRTFTANRVVREGLIAGLLGAAAVAVWFLIIDVAAGRLFYTPAALGSALFLQAEGPHAVSISPMIVGGYTLLHVCAFIALGLVAAAIVLRAEAEPHVLLGAVLLFVTMEAFIIGVIAILAAWLLSTIAWWTIAAANIIAAMVMGFYLWRAHPALHGELGKQSLEEPLMSL